MPQHAAIERQVDLKQVCRSRADYADHLARMYGFYQPLEDALWRQDTVREAGFGNDRRKTPLLVHDLCALGREPGSLSLCQTFAPTLTEARAMGCLYVLEGASLGGQIITRVVRERLGITPDTGGAFFYGYGDETGTMWQSFRTALEAYADDTERQAAVIAAATATFAALGNWLETEKRKLANG